MIIIGLLFLYLFMIAPSFEKKFFTQKKFAHRGYHSQDQKIKENSMEAFRLAKERGYGIELDVQLNQEGQVVVYHDFHMKRLENLDTMICDMNNDACIKYGIPTLREVLDLIDGKVELIIELKSDKNRNVLSAKVYEILKDYKGPFGIESFDPRIVYWFRKHAPEIKRGQLIMPVINYESKLVGLVVNSLLYQFLTRPHFLAINVKSFKFNPSIKLNHLLGVDSCLWTVHVNHKVNYKWVDAYIFEYFEA